MIARYNVDAPVLSPLPFSKEPGVIPRTEAYGHADGLIPYGEAFVDGLVQPSDYKEVIADCHKKEIFPVYHQRTAGGAVGEVWDQGTLNLCWAWGITRALMDTRAREGKPYVPLAPVSLGGLVGWRNKGNYLLSAINGVKTQGIASTAFIPDQHSLSHRRYKEGWEGDALNYRLAKVWDCDNSARLRMIQHCISVLRTGTPLYVAYNFWGHALELAYLKWDESVPNDLIWGLRNSHKERDLIEMTGDRAVPSEAYGIPASLTV